MAAARILLTGATGFVGNALLRHLAADGHGVVALTGGRDCEVRHPSVTARRLDLLAATQGDVAQIVAETGATHCLHAAWYTNHADYLTAEVNRDWLAAGIRLANGFYQGGGRRFVGLGTCIEYDQQGGDGRFVEDVTPLQPDTLYARCKLELFERLRERSAADGSDFAWARLFFVYGPGDRANRLVPYILDNLADGKPVSPRFGGLRRDYIHVDDLAAQLSAIVAGDVRGAINTATGEAVKLADIFGIASALVGRPDLTTTNDALDPGQSAVIEADMTRYMRQVGTPSCRSLEDGLAKLIADRRA